MAGNVWEWMENLYGDKDYRRARSLRGGSWNDYERYLRCSSRLYYDPFDRLNHVGFRVVCSQSCPRWVAQPPCPDVGVFTEHRTVARA